MNIYKKLSTANFSKSKVFDDFSVSLHVRLWFPRDLYLFRKLKQFFISRISRHEAICRRFIPCFFNKQIELVMRHLKQVPSKNQKVLVLTIQFSIKDKAEEQVLNVFLTSHQPSLNYQREKNDRFVQFFSQMESFYFRIEQSVVRGQSFFH